MILGPFAEEQLRRALQISNGELTGLYDTWFSKTVYAVILVLLVAPAVIDQVRRRRGSSLTRQHANQEGQ